MTGRFLAIAVVTLLLSLAITGGGLAIFAAVYQGKLNNRDARINDLEGRLQTLCARKYVVGVQLDSSGRPSVRTEQGC